MENQDWDNTNRGTLFKNDKKESERHPDYKGSINVNGQEFWLSSWIKTSKAGKQFMSLSVQPKEQQQVQAQQPAPQQTFDVVVEDENSDESIPF